MLAGALLLASSLFAAGCGPNLPAERPVDRELAEQIRADISEGTGGPAVAVARPDPTGWATLSGSFKFAPGDASKFSNPPALAVSGDDGAYCNRGGAPKSQSLLVDGEGNIANVVIFLGDNLSKVEKPELWIHPSATGSTEPVTFDQKACVFLSPITTMQVSQPLHILNSDGVGHNTKLENANPMSEILPPGGKITYEHRKEERQPYAVSCNIHPWMKAYILVRNNGYFAQTDEQGKFKIENLPAGVDLTMKVWHEAAGGFLTDVTVNGETKKWPKKGFPVKLTADGEMKLDVVLDAGPFSN